MDITLVPYASQDNPFSVVMPMLQKVERRAQQPGLAQRLMLQRVQGMSYMDLILCRGEMLGVVVASPHTDALWVEAIYLKPHQCDDEAMRTIDAHLQARARTHKLPRLRGSQRFRGGKPFMERAGWKMFAAQYEREVGP